MGDAAHTAITLGILLLSQELAVLIEFPKVRLPIALGIYFLTLDFFSVIEIKPCVNPTVLLARDLLSFWFSAFVENPNIRLSIKINVLFDPFHLAVFVVIDPEVNFPIPVGILLLTNDTPLLILIEACYYTWRQLASGGIIHKEDQQEGNEKKRLFKIVPLHCTTLICNLVLNYIGVQQRLGAEEFNQSFFCRSPSLPLSS